MGRLKLFWAFILLCFLIQPNASAKRWALLVGINDYVNPEIRDLRGCERDVSLMAEALKRFGFTTEDMKILLSRNATRHAILSAFEEWLIKKPKPGDVVVFYFSGHGSRVVDESGDESDGWDEILCPVDLTPTANRERYQNPILDDELGKLIHQIPTDNVTVILDSCHSGTATKSLVDAGLTIPKMISRDLLLKRRGPPNRLSKQRESISIEMQNANHVLISGSAAEEVSLDAMWPSTDGKSFFAGVLTKNLVEALRGATEETRYVDLMEEVSKAVRQRSPQTPQFEGDINRPIFARRNSDGTFSPTVVPPAKPSVLVTKVEENLVTINAGTVQGVTKGSLYEIFSPIENSFTGNPLALIQIMSVTTDRSTGKILKSRFSIVPLCRAVESSHAYPPDKLYLQVRISGDSSQSEKLNEVFSKIPDLVIVEYGRYADVVLEVQVGDAQLNGNLISDDGVILDKVTASDVAELAEKLRPKLENAFAVKRLMRLKNPNPPFKITVWTDRGNRPVYHIGEAAVFKFKSEQNCYLTLLNVDTQGQVTMLFPNAYHPSNRIIANKTYTIPSDDMKFKIFAREPTGKQLIKVIATTTPVTIPEFDLNRTKDIFLSVGGVNEIHSFTKGLGRAFIVEGTDREMENIIHLPTSKWVTSELIAEIR